MSFVNQGGIINTGVQVVQTSAPSEIVAVSPLASNQVLGNDGAGNIAPVNLVAGSNVTIVQSDNNITVASTASTPGSTGLFSPVNISIGSIPSNVAITTAFTSLFPPLSAMQTIATLEITPKYGNTPGLVSTLQVYCLPVVEGVNTQSLGVQFAVYASTTGDTVPVDDLIYDNGSMSTSSYSNVGSLLLLGQIPSSQNTPVTFTLAASYIQSSGAQVLADALTFYVVENVGDTLGVVQSNVIDLGTTNVTVTAPRVTADIGTYNNTTPLIGSNKSFYKNYGTSNLNISLSVQLNGLNTTSEYWAGVAVYFGNSTYTGSVLNPAILAYNTGNLGNGRTNTSAPLYTGVGGSAIVPPNFAISSGQTLQAGTTNVYMGAIYQSNEFQFLPVESYLVIDEVLPISSGGIIQSYALPTFQATASVYSSTTSPQYSATFPLGSYTVTPLASGGYMQISGTIESNTPQFVPSGELQALYCFYTSNSPTATPFAVRSVSMSKSQNSAVNSQTFNPYCVIIDTVQAQVPITIYVTLCSLTVGAVTGQSLISGSFQEVFIGNTIVSGTIDTIVAEDYLTVSLSGNSATLGTIPATSTQAGLVTANSAIPANSLLQMESSGAVGCTISSTDNSVVITPSSGTIDLSSPLNISTGTGAFGVVRSNNLNVASISPSVAWNADYLVGGASSGSQKPIFDSTASFVSAYTGSSSQLNLSEYTRFTATAASPPSANNTASPQWIAVIQPLSVTLLQPKVIELIITPALLGALSTQAQAFSKDAYYRYVLGVNMTSTGTPIQFNRMTLLPLESDLYGQTTVPTVADTPPWFTFSVIPAAGNPSSQFTTGNVLVVYAQWILSTVTGITPRFNLAFRTLF